MKLKYIIIIISLMLRLAASSSIIDPICKVCEELIHNIQLKIENDITNKEIIALEKFASDVCLYRYEQDTNRSPVDKTVCDGLINEFSFEVVYILAQSKLSPNSICSLLDKCHRKAHQPWNISINENKPPITHPALVGNATKWQILHITDLHYDPKYTPHATTDCGEPVCCRSSDTIVNNSSGGGIWGDYRDCDTPLWTFENMLAYISKNFNISYVFFAGDAVAHTVWDTTPEGNLDILNTTYQLVRKYLPEALWVGTIGNHDPSPVNMVPPPGVYTGPNGINSIDWLYTGVANIWKESLDDDAYNKLSDAGFFSQRLDDHLVVISLNMNFGDDENWWLLVDPVDPGNMLSWLEKTLNIAEANKDKVYIIGHKPPHEALHSFKVNYFNIIYRYENTIIGQFFGHSHEDRFVVYLDPKNTSRGFANEFIPGSITPFSHLNVGFRIYDIDAKYKYITDSYNYIFNLTLANMDKNEPDWYLEYSARNAYGFKSGYILPQNWIDLTLKFEVNNAMWDEYQFYQTKSARHVICHDQCKRDQLCDMRFTGDHYGDPLCDRNEIFF